MKLKKYHISATILLMLVVFFFGSNLFAETPTVRLIADPFGNFSYTMATAFEDIAKKHYPKLNISVEEGFGLIYNMKKLDRATPEEKKHTIALAADGVIWMAQNGKKPFEKKIALDVVPLCNSISLSTWFMTFDPKIKTLADLEGKTVGIGKKTQQAYGQTLWQYLDIGWGLGDKINVQWIGNKGAVTALKDGLVDVAPAGGSINPVTYDYVLDPLTTEVTAFGKKVYFLSPGKEALDKIRTQTGFPCQYISIPAGAIKGHDRPITTHINQDCWAASKELPEEIAYHFVKMLIQNAEKLKVYHTMGKLITPKTLGYGWKPEELHPGAYRALKEAGLMQ